MWDNLSSVDFDLSFDETDGIAYASIFKKSGTTSLEVTIVVYRLLNGTWEYVDSNYCSSQSNVVMFVEFTGVPNVQYKAVLDITAYQGNVGEEINLVRFASI